MNNVKKQIGGWLRFYIVILILSGISTMPLEQELSFIIRQFPSDGSIKGWFVQVLKAVQETGKEYPFLFYGYDWLAFAHFMLAILFIGPLMDPVKNKWVMQFGIIACILVIPFAFIAGSIRGIPVWWSIVDCLFGILGLIPLAICLHKTGKLEKTAELEAVQKEEFDLLVA